MVKRLCSWTKASVHGRSLDLVPLMHGRSSSRLRTHLTALTLCPVCLCRMIPGLLILYYAGVMTVLQQLGIVRPDQAPPRVAGISSGALTAGAICSGMTAEQFQSTVGTCVRGG